MINFDSLSLKVLTAEIAGILEGGRVQKIQQPSRTELVITIRSQGKAKKLYININPKLSYNN